MYRTDIRDKSETGAAGREVSGRPQSLARWAQDSASSWGPTTVRTLGYVTMPSFRGLKDGAARRQHGAGDDEGLLQRIAKQVDLCEHFLIGPKGNRSCFNKCN